MGLLTGAGYVRVDACRAGDGSQIGFGVEA